MLETRVTVSQDEDNLVDFILPETDSRIESVTVSAAALSVPEEIKSSHFQIFGSEIVRSPGTLQDLSQYVQSLPGVAKGLNDLGDQLQVRGGNSYENLYVIDNIDVPDVSHFSQFASSGGLFSVLDASLIQDANFFSGGYPAPFGNAASSVLQIAEREGSREGVHGRVSLDLLDGGVSLEGPFGSSSGGVHKGSWIVGFRRSFIDLLEHSSDTGRQGGFPTLYTYNAKVSYNLTARDKVWLVNVSDTDSVVAQPRVGQKNDQEIDNYVVGYDSFRSSNGLNWQHVFGASGIGLLAVTDTEGSIHANVKDILFRGVPPAGESVPQQIANATQIASDDQQEGETDLKYDFTFTSGFWGKLQAGASAKFVHSHYDFSRPYGDQNPYSLDPYVNPVSSRERVRETQPGAYVQLTRNVAKRLNVTIGGRFDDFRFIGQRRYSPRAGVRYQISERVSLHASAGKYYQQPPWQFLTAFRGENGALYPIHADHFVAGATFQQSAATRIAVEVYRKNYRDYPVSTQFPQLTLANIAEFTTPNEVIFPVVSSGRGRSQGVELLVERKFGDRWFGQANFSAAESFAAALDGAHRQGTLNYPYIGNVLGGVHVSPHWTVSARATYLSGRPYTPFDSALSSQQRRAIYDLAEVNGRHLPSYFRLDVRLDHDGTLLGKPLNWYLGALNASGGNTITGYEWNRRTNLPQIDRETGVFPVLGAELRF